MSTLRLHAAQMAIWYITWGVLAYVMTLGKANRQARDWVFTGQIVMLAVEVAIVTTPGGDGVLPSWLFPHMAEYEVRGWVMHAALLRACVYTKGINSFELKEMGVVP